MRSQPPSVISMHETPIDSGKNGRSVVSASTTPISSSDSPITGNRQKVSPTSKCVLWKQRNEVIITMSPPSFEISNMKLGNWIDICLYKGVILWAYLLFIESGCKFSLHNDVGI